MTVTFETACRLNGDGFPQPSLSYLQKWCTKIDFETFERHIIGFPGDKFYIYADSFDTSNICFMPTATDILKELPEYAIAKHIDYYNTSGEAWFCWDTANKTVIFSHPTNPAEAAARAWFHENKK